MRIYYRTHSSNFAWLQHEPWRTSRLSDILYKLVTWLIVDTFMFPDSKFTKLHPKLTERGRALALSNTAVKHNEYPTCHFDYFDLNAPNSCLFLQKRYHLHRNEFKEGGVVYSWRDQSYSVWRIGTRQLSQVTNRRGEGGTLEFCFRSRKKKFPETWATTTWLKRSHWTVRWPE